MKLKPTLFVSSFLAACILGCGNNANEAKVDSLLKRMASTKPGSVRLLNLSNEAFDMSSKGVTLAHDVSPGTESKFAMSGAGQKVFTLKSPSRSLDVSVTLKSELGQTVILLPDGKRTIAIEGELVKPTNDANVSIYKIDESGALVKDKVDLKFKAGSGTISLDSEKPEGKLELGSYTFTVNAGQPADANVVEDKSYTLLLIKTSAGKWISRFMENTGLTKPLSGGMSRA